MQQCHDEALLKLYEVINLYTGLNRLNMGNCRRRRMNAWFGNSPTS